MKQTIFATAILIAGISVATAGTITKDAWKPSSCGPEPEVPVVNGATPDTYNDSVKAINAWQEKANLYNTCLINEANADNALIAKSANDGQGRLKAAVEKIKTDIEAAAKKLDGK